MFRESSIVTCLNQIIDWNIGTPSTVEFDFEKIWKKRDFAPHIHFYHVHPYGMLEYSDLDRQVMKGYALALGYSSQFTIVCFDDNDIMNTKHKYRSYIYNKNEDRIELGFCERTRDSFGMPLVKPSIKNGIILSLKLMSYGITKEIENE